MFSKTITAVTALLALTSSANAAPCASVLSKTAQLRLADTAIDRFALLSKDEDFIFDFSQETSAPAAIADAVNFPALVSTGMSLIAAPVPACAVAPLHFHPRAAELFYVATGRIQTYIVLESGSFDAEGKPRIVRGDLVNNTMTVFHQGAVHVQFNPECEPALAIAAFNSEDFGTGLVQVPMPSDDNMTATFGEQFGFEVDSCRAKCGDKAARGLVMF